MMSRCALLKSVLLGCLLPGCLLLGNTAWMASLAWGETIQGEACYRYGAAETFNAAKHISISLAKRNALENYKPFAEAAVNMQEPRLRNELLANLTVQAMRNVQVTRSEEDREAREICSEVRAEVEPDALKKRISAVFNAFQKKLRPGKTWLPRNAHVRVVNIREFPCTFDQEIQCLGVVVECLLKTPGERAQVRIIWYDQEGIPAFSIKRGVGCERRGDVSNFMLRLPPPSYTFVVDLP